MWPFRRQLWWIHRWCDQHILERPGFWGNQWRLFHAPDWQKSSKFNARLWVCGFVCFYPLASQIGHSWFVNLGVTFGLDFLVYLFYKKELWPERKVSYSRSYAVWVSFWMVTVSLNMGAAWFFLNQIQLGNAPSKAVLGVFGVVINPWEFRFRKKWAIPNRPPKTKMA